MLHVAAFGSGTMKAKGRARTAEVSVITDRPPRMSFEALTSVLAPASVTADPRPSAKARPDASNSAVQANQRPRESLGAEGLQVLGLLPDADKMDGQRKFFGDSD
jgi:hypothetical protein